MTGLRIGVYAEVDANLIDGSSVWLQSLTLMLARVPEAYVVVILRTSPQRDVVLGPLRDLSNVDLVDAAARQGVRRLDAAGAAAIAAELDDEHRFDAFFVRGAATADALSTGPLAGRLWLYHVPSGDDAGLGRRLNAAQRILCQTPAIQARVEEVALTLSTKCVRLPPMVPDLPRRAPMIDPARPRFAYAGKFSPEYCFFETLEAFARVRASHPAATLAIAGDKIHNPSDDPTFQPRVRDALLEAPGITWHAGIPRDEVLELLSASDIAFSLRTSALDSSDEISTKVLEYGIAGCAVVLNRAPVYSALLGDDYPLFADDVTTAGATLTAALRDADVVAEAAARCRRASESYTFETVAQQIATAIQTNRAGPALAVSRPATTLLLAGHDLKFTGPIQQLATRLGSRVVQDRWARHNDHDEDESRRAIAEADVILCEWCMGNASWYAAHRRPEQRLVVRFHRSELGTPYPGWLDPRETDRVVFVADWVRDEALRTFSWPADGPYSVIENSVDLPVLDQPKLPGAPFNLGLIGWVPKLKRLDRALDVLERLRATDSRFRLAVKGRAPWEFAWMLGRDEERLFYEECFARIRRSPLLRNAVTFVPHGPDVADFLRQVGWIVSVSDIEGHAVALAEGMASGAAAVIFDRPGAAAQYPAAWVHDSVDAAVRHIRGATADAPTYDRLVEATRAHARRWSPEAVFPRWEELLFGRNSFAPSSATALVSQAT